MKKVFYAIVLFASCFSINAYCQGGNAVLQNAVAGLKTLSTDHIIEKAYLHFDKPYYAAGDTIYFKAYVTLGERHDLSKASGILYVDLINSKNVIANSLKLQLINGLAWGDFNLPDSLQKGNYRIRAYTKYMQNNPDYFFDQPIPIGSIVNKGISENSPRSAQSQKGDIQFFPEGGELVTSLVSKVAFKAIGTNGAGTNVKGVIVDNTNKEVTKFASTHLGMGVFMLEAEEGKTYKAKVTFADGTQNTVDLPAPVAKGIVLVVKDTLDKISLEIRSNKAYFAENINKDLNLVIYCGGLVSTVNTKLDSRRLNMDIPHSQFASGIVKITLFSQTGEPLSERLAFLQNPDLLKLAVSSDKTGYQKRERVQINVNAKNKAGIGADGHFSVSVIDESKVPVDENNETTILSYLLLTAELHGYVEQPNYYFAHNTNETQAALDVLMLTQGYRRFTWKRLLGDNSAKFTYAPEKTFDITGQAKSTAGVPATKKDLMLTASIGGSVLGDKTDDEGNFAFKNLVFMDNTGFTLQVTGSSKNKSTTILTVNQDKPGPSVSDINIPGSSDDVNRQMIAYLDNSQQQQDQLYKLGLKRSIFPQRQKSGGVRNADQVIQGNEISTLPSLVTALSGRLNGVDFIQGIPYLKGGGDKDPMLIVVDGKIRGSYVNLNNISPGDVQTVELLKGSNADAYGIYGNAGVLAITTRKGASNGDIGNDSYKFDSKKVVPLKDVTVTQKSKTYRSSSLSGPGHADQVVNGDEIKNSPTVSDGLSGLLRGIDIVGGTAYLKSGGVVTLSGGVQEPMLLMVDGARVGNGGLSTLNPNEVETVEVLKGPNASIYGVEGGAGVLVVTTRIGGANTESNAPTAALGTLQFTPKGFYKAREFYSPRYENTKANNRLDLRSTIFWKPELVTDKDGNISFDFYNSDGHGTYRLVIEGIDNAGNIGRQIYKYKVD
ncbi:MAG TPA: TonB-dependent receptor plug domain-containing protein [Mucilaginibacter sp.]|nr:TonB-dependent receptor plug domain-containing protein [Mucilaginibacter sp.]